MFAWFAACAASRAPTTGIAGAGLGPSSTHYVLHGASLAGGAPADVEVMDGRIAAVGNTDPAAEVVDVSGRWLAPAFIDSHVHLAYLPEVDAMAQGGVAAAVDLAAPVGWLAEDHAPLVVVAAGPMVTAVGGYPTQGWGAGGYGVECAGADEAVAAVRDLAVRGAGVIKLPVTGEPVLDDDALRAAADAAHALGLKVASHALGDDEALRAANAGADILAHAPTEILSQATLDAWAGRALIGTLAAFGGGDPAVANVVALRARGVTLLYGTDFGNTRHAGIDPNEIALLEAAGLDGAAILAAGTSIPATFWGLTDLGAIEVGRRASILVLASDPTTDPAVLASPEQVYIDGARVR